MLLCLEKIKFSLASNENVRIDMSRAYREEDLLSREILLERGVNHYMFDSQRMQVSLVRIDKVVPNDPRPKSSSYEVKVVNSDYIIGHYLHLDEATARAKMIEKCRKFGCMRVSVYNRNKSLSRKYTLSL
jgi:hypothetical protein